MTHSMPTVNVEKAVVALLELSRQYPDEEIRLTIKDGSLTVGIAKGAYGDRVFATWQALVPSLLVGMS